MEAWKQDCFASQTWKHFRSGRIKYIQSVSLPSSREVSHPFLVYVSILSTADRCAPSLQAGARRGRSSSRKMRRRGGQEEGKAAVVGAVAMVMERLC